MDYYPTEGGIKMNKNVIALKQMQWILFLLNLGWLKFD